jgi:hypothetical protein
MYAKLFERITESSLMEEDINTRYVFMMLLAIADKQGTVIGTDIAIARRLNIPLNLFKYAMSHLASPDPDSNSKDYSGKRVVPSNAERGYLIVNYLKYRSFKNEDGKREYMREYMAKRRGKETSVNPVLTPVSPVLTVLAHTEAEAEAEAETETETETETESCAVVVPEKPDPPKKKKRQSDASDIALEIYDAYPKKVGRGAALKAIQKAIDRGNSPESVLEATKAYAKSALVKTTESQFLPHASTWYNQDRFLDDRKNWTARNTGNASFRPAGGTDDDEDENLSILDIDDNDDNEEWVKDTPETEAAYLEEQKILWAENKILAAAYEARLAKEAARKK